LLEDRTAPAGFIWTDADAAVNSWWSNRKNWVDPTGAIPTVAPGAGDDVILGISGGLGSNADSLVNQAFTGTIRSLEILPGYGTVKLTRSLTIAGTGPLSSQSGGTISADNAQTLSVSAGTFNVTAGTIATNITLSMASGSTLNVTGGDQTAATLTNNGTANLANSNWKSVTTGGTMSLSKGSGAVTLTNTGTLNVVSDTDDLGTFDNQGTLSLNGGTLRLTAGGTQTTAGASTVFNGGSMTVFPNAAYVLQAGNLYGNANGSTFRGDLTNNGASLYASGLTGTGTFTISGGQYTQGAGGTLVITVDVNKNQVGMLQAPIASLGGTLTINWIDGTPALRSIWNVLSFSNGIGATNFATINGLNGPSPTYVAGSSAPYQVKV
jgi:hypothetical protein